MKDILRRLLFLPLILAALLTISGLTARADNGPTAVTLLYFEGYGTADGVMLEWATGTEFDTAGFWIERGSQQIGPFTRLLDNIGFIPAMGEGIVGAEYEALDDTAVIGATYWYRLIEREVDGSENIPEPPIAVTAGVNAPTATPTQTPTPSQTPTPTQTPTPSRTPTASATPTPSQTATPGPSPTPTLTPFIAPTATPTTVSGAAPPTATTAASLPAPFATATATAAVLATATPTTTAAPGGDQGGTAPPAALPETTPTAGDAAGDGTTAQTAAPTPGETGTDLTAAPDAALTATAVSQEVAVIGGGFVPTAAPTSPTANPEPSPFNVWGVLLVALAAALLTGFVVWRKLNAGADS